MIAAAGGWYVSSISSSFRGLSDKWLLVNVLDNVCVASPNIDTYTENIDMYTEYAYIDITLVVWY